MKPLAAIVGATGTGKTQLAVQLSRHCNIEVVSCDCGQIYRGLDIGTAKPTVEERSIVTHHLIDILAPNEQWSAAEFAEAADRVIQQIRVRGALPVLVGGNGLWFRALTRGIFEAPPIDAALRACIREELRTRGAQAMHEVLAKVDPVAATRIQAQDSQRIGRALEVFRQTGTPISVLQDEHRFSQSRYQVSAILMDWEREVLRAHLANRVERMFEQGLVEETEACLSSGVPFDAPGLATIGYKQAVQHLRGQISRKEALDLSIHATRQYAKRQRNWFRHEPDVAWLCQTPSLEEVLRCLRPAMEGV